MLDEDFEYIRDEAETARRGKPGAGKKKNARRRRRAKKPMAVLQPVLIVTILIALGLSAVLYLQLRSERTERARAEETLAETEEIIETTLYEPAEVERMLAEASAAAREEGIRQYRDELRGAIEEPDAKVFEVLRRFYPEYVLYSGPDGNHFVPIEESYPVNTVSDADLSVSENGVISYVIDGEERSEMMLDVSQFQGRIDWAQVAESGVRKAIIRAGFRGYGSGKLVTDEQFINNIEGATEQGIEVGVYFFTQAVTLEEAHEEADYVLELIAPYEVTLPVVLDVERIANDEARGDAISRELRTDLAIAFLEDVRAAGYTPMIYGNLHGLFGMLELDRVIDYPIWFAYYDTYIYYPYRLKCWQYTESGVVPGISGKVDLNLWLE